MAGVIFHGQAPCMHPHRPVLQGMRPYTAFPYTAFPILCACVQNDMGSPTRRSMRSTASSGVDSPKAPWSANSGGVRHGAVRSICASRRKSSAPARARPQVRFQGPHVCCP